MTTESRRARLVASIPVRPLQLAIGLLISAVALYIALSEVNWSRAGDALREANYWWLVPAVAVMLTVLMMRAIRWRLLFYPQTGLSLRRFFAVLNVGYMVNNIFPFQIGDLVRAYLLGQYEGLSKSRTFSTVVIERMVDVLVLFAFLMVIVPFVAVPAWAAIPVAAAAGIVLFVGLVLVGMAGNRQRVLDLVDTLLRFVPGRFHDNFRRMAGSALDGLAVLHRPRILAAVIVWSALSWLMTALVIYCVMLAFNLDAGFSAAMFVAVMTSLGFFVPSSPGALGVYHAISIESLVRVFDVERDLAASYSMVAYLIFYLPPVIIGLVLLWREHLSWRQLQAWSASQSNELEAVPVVPAAHDEAESSA